MKTLKYIHYVYLLCILQGILSALAYTHSAVWIGVVGLLTVLAYYIGQRSVVDGGER